MSKQREPINAKVWLENLAGLRGEKNIALVKSAIDLYGDDANPKLANGLGIADILLTLGLDNETLAAVIAYPLLQAHEIHMDSIAECLSEKSSKLLTDVLQMQSLGKIGNFEQRGSHQLENFRKMLLAMVTDVRAVLIIIAERLWKLRQAKNIDKDEQQQLAKETLAVYAPLANRLGVWQIKWEIEDLCLRYMEPEIYVSIAKGIASRRDDREVYIKNFIELTTELLNKSGMHEFSVTGRVKHIYSIYKKMTRKNSDLQQIYDKSAIRVLVNTIDECYTVLSVLQDNLHSIPEEFDDYISNPKPNGYRSLHAVLIGPENHNVEVQIRTHKMHQESELGVAAHWRYKEGVLQTESYEAKIALLRQLMEWQKEVVNRDEDKPTQDLFADKIYVFTPLGDIIDLPKGATPLDFAYTIHSEVGHRCRGAKVDGSIVPLIYELQTGQRVEILTAKQPHPSRDWLIPQLGFVKSARARAKIQHWFREQDGEPMAAPERGAPQSPPKVHNIEIRKSATPDVTMVGISNLLTHIALCCKPLPGDDIVGYVTRTRGLSIHRRNCENMRDITNDGVNRLMEVSWGEKKQTGGYSADLLVRVQDRNGLLRDITTTLASEKVNILAVQIQKLPSTEEVDIYITVDIANRNQLKTIMDLIRKIPEVIEVRRR